MAYCRQQCTAVNTASLMWSFGLPQLLRLMPTNLTPSYLRHKVLAHRQHGIKHHWPTRDWLLRPHLMHNLLHTFKRSSHLLRALLGTVVSRMLPNHSRQHTRRHPPKIYHLVFLCTRTLL